MIIFKIGFYRTLTKMMAISHQLNLILVVIVIGRSFYRVSSSPSNFTERCHGVCGGLILPYPFGFSPGCPIRFSCSTTDGARIGVFSVQNVTKDSIFVGVTHDCNRRIEDMKPLFGEHYAPTSQNSFLMEECINATDGCSIKQKFLESQLNLQSCDYQGNISCFSTDTNSTKFFSMKDLRNSSCKKLFSSIAFEPVGANVGIALEFERVRLGWWLNGDCGTGNSTCAANANCEIVETPDGNAGHRCSCREGYHGDGFIKSPCRKGYST